MYLCVEFPHLRFGRALPSVADQSALMSLVDWGEDEDSGGPASAPVTQKKANHVGFNCTQIFRIESYVAVSTSFPRNPISPLHSASQDRVGRLVIFFLAGFITLPFYFDFKPRLAFSFPAFVCRQPPRLLLNTNPPNLRHGIFAIVCDLFFHRAQFAFYAPSSCFFPPEYFLLFSTTLPSC